MLGAEPGARHEPMNQVQRISQIAALGLLLAMAAGCTATRPTKYYVLDAPAAPVPTTQAAIPVRLIVGHVTGSRLYHDTRLVYGTGTVQLGTYDYHRWSEPPVAFVQEILIATLRQSGQYRSVSRIGSNARGDYIVRGQLDALDEIDKPALAGRFTFRLELFDPGTGTVVWSSAYNHDEPAQGKEISDIVLALDRNVSAGLQQLTSELGQYLAAHPGQQPTGD